MAATTTNEARIELAAAHRLVVRNGLKDLSLGNHFTLVDPEKPSRLLATPPYESWPLVTASSIRVFESEGDAAADPALWIDYRIHKPIHDARKDAACVMHLHPPYLTALSMIDGGLGRASQGAMMMHGRLAYTDSYDGAVGHLGTSQGELLAEALGEDNVAVLMRNHGILTVGTSVAHAYALLLGLEREAQYRMLALSTERRMLERGDESTPDPVGFSRAPGRSADTPPVDQRQANFDAQRAVLDLEEPDYRD